MTARNCIARLATGAIMLTALFFAATPAFAAGLYSALVSPRLAASLGEPADLAVALNGETFIADAANGRVAVMVNGTIVRDWDGSEGVGPELRRPSGICIGPDDLVYVADSLGDVIVVYQRNGAYVRTIGSSGSANGQLLGPSDVVVDAGGVWVADAFNDRVQRFTAAGAWVRTVGGGSSGMFMQPASLDLYNGLVYVTEATGRRGQAFNATTYAVAVGPWGVTDSGGGIYVSRYLRPAGIDVDAAGRMFLVDGGRGVVEQMSASSVVSTLALGGTAVGLSQPDGVVSSGDDLWVADALNDRIAQYRFSLASWAQGIKPAGSTEVGRYTDPSGIVPLANGDFIVCDTGAGRVQQVDAAGETVRVFESTGDAAVDAPYGAAVIGTELFVADAGRSRIQVYDLTAGTYLRSIGASGAGDGQFSAPTALAADPNGNLLVSDTGNNRIQRITTAGAHLQTLAAVGVTSPRGVAVDAAGIVFVADTGGHRLRSYSAAGALISTWGTFGSGNGQLSSPQGLAIDPVTGQLMVADTGNHRISVFTSAGSFVSHIGGRGTSAMEFRSPKALVVSSDRSIAVADSGNHRIQKAGYDSAAPSTTATGIPPSWINTPVTVTLSATDTASGVATTFYRIGTGADTTYTAPVVISAQGTTSFRYWSVDKTGNAELAKIATIRIDSVPPAGTMAVAADAAFVGSRTVSVDSTVTDAVSMSVDVGAGFGARIPYGKTTTVTLPGEGVQTVRVRYYDALDNVLTLSDQLTVDLTGPSVTLPRSPASSPTSQSVAVTVSASDALSGVAQRFVKVDSGTEVPYSAPVTVDGEGPHVVYGRAVDAVGNSATVSTSFLIDRTGPVSELAGVEPNELLAVPAVFTLSATDALTSVSSTRYVLDGGAEKIYSGAVTVSSDGTHTVTYSAYDIVGNLGPSQSMTFTVDRTAPVPTASGVVPGSYRATDTTITLAAQDAVSGVDSIRYSVDGSAFAEYSEPLVVSGEGEHVVEYQACDMAGNWSDLATLSFTIDKRVPTGTMLAEEGRQFVNDTTISLASSVTGAAEMRFDTGSGFGEWMPYEAEHQVMLDGEGSHTIVGEFRSLAGLATQLPAGITVDMTAPTVGAVRFTPTSVQITSTQTLVRLNGRWDSMDGGAAPSGIAWHSAQLAGRGYDPAQPLVDFAPLALGAYTARTSAGDSAGNVSRPADTSVRLGAYIAPTLMRRTGTNTVRFTVAGVTPQPGEQAVFRCFKQDRDGSWRLARTTAAKATTTLSGPALTNAVPLTPGVWRISLETRTPSAYRLGKLSAAISIR